MLLALLSLIATAPLILEPPQEKRPDVDPSRRQDLRQVTPAWLDTVRFQALILSRERSDPPSKEDDSRRVQILLVEPAMGVEKYFGSRLTPREHLLKVADMKSILQRIRDDQIGILNQSITALYPNQSAIATSNGRSELARAGYFLAMIVDQVGAKTVSIAIFAQGEKRIITSDEAQYSKWTIDFYGQLEYKQWYLIMPQHDGALLYVRILESEVPTKRAQPSSQPSEVEPLIIDPPRQHEPMP